MERYINDSNISDVNDTGSSSHVDSVSLGFDTKASGQTLCPYRPNGVSSSGYIRALTPQASDQDHINVKGRARKRIAVACMRCRKRKIKCSGNVNGAGCKSCVESTSSCQFHRIGVHDLSFMRDIPYPQVSHVSRTISPDQSQSLQNKSYIYSSPVPTRDNGPVLENVQYSTSTASSTSSNSPLTPCYETKDLHQPQVLETSYNDDDSANQVYHFPSIPNIESTSRGQEVPVDRCNSFQIPTSSHFNPQYAVSGLGDIPSYLADRQLPLPRPSVSHSQYLYNYAITPIHWNNKETIHVVPYNSNVRTQLPNSIGRNNLVPCNEHSQPQNYVPTLNYQSHHGSSDTPSFLNMSSAAYDNRSVPFEITEDVDFSANTPVNTPNSQLHEQSTTENPGSVNQGTCIHTDEFDWSELPQINHYSLDPSTSRRNENSLNS